MQNFNLNGRTIAIIALVVIAAVVLLPRLLGNDDNGGILNSNDNPPVNVNPRDTTVNQDDGIELGRVVTASGLDRDNCPTSTTTNFSPDDIVYVVAEDSDVVQGTEIYVRWYLNGEALEDTDIVEADEDYSNACIFFTLEPDDANQLPSGDYEAEFFINGNAADSASFQVQ